jgi:hypothetical protein
VQERQAVDEACTKPRRIVRTNHVSSSCIGPKTHSQGARSLRLSVTNRLGLGRFVGFHATYLPQWERSGSPRSHVHSCCHMTGELTASSRPRRWDHQKAWVLFSPDARIVRFGIPVVPLSQQNRQFRMNQCASSRYVARCRALGRNDRECR